VSVGKLRERELLCPALARKNLAGLFGRGAQAFMRSKAAADSNVASTAAPLLGIHFNRIDTPATAADSSRPTFGPLSCKITPLVFCN
jgi:hypothetical protein